MYCGMYSCTVQLIFLLQESNVNFSWWYSVPYLELNAKLNDGMANKKKWLQITMAFCFMKTDSIPVIPFFLLSHSLRFKIEFSGALST